MPMQPRPIAETSRFRPSVRFFICFSLGREPRTRCAFRDRRSPFRVAFLRMSILIGTQGSNYAAWVGPFYQPGTRAPEFLPSYARAFRAVEVDSTFYAIPDAREVRAWADRTPPEFTVALQLSKEVTQERLL